MKNRWTVRITESAAKDFSAAIRWSLKQFGTKQTQTYSAVLTDAIQELRSGPVLNGVKVRDEIAKGIKSIHVAQRGRRGRHFIIFRVVSEKQRVLEVLRILHDAMDLPRHGIE